MVAWACWRKNVSHFFRCFNTVAWVLWSVKLLFKLAYTVQSGTLNPTIEYSVIVTYETRFPTYYINIRTSLWCFTELKVSQWLSFMHTLSVCTRIYSVLWHTQTTLRLLEESFLGCSLPWRSYQFVCCPFESKGQKFWDERNLHIYRQRITSLCNGRKMWRTSNRELL